jgi:hypothetical protein
MLRYKKILLWKLKARETKKIRKWLQLEAIHRRERHRPIKKLVAPSYSIGFGNFQLRSKLTSQATLRYKKILLWELKARETKKIRKWLQQEAIHRRERQRPINSSLLPRTVSDSGASNCESKLTSQATLRIQGQRDEENTKVVATRSYPPTRVTASDKKRIAPSYSIGFGSFKLLMEADITSYAMI